MMSFFSNLFGFDNKTQKTGGNDMLKIGIVLGSTREGRVSPQVGAWVKELADKRGDAEYQIIDIAEFKLPLLGEAGGDASGAAAWSAQINGCDGFVFITQEYNHSITGALKNALDYLRDEWNNKAAGIVSYGSVGGAQRFINGNPYEIVAEDGLHPLIQAAIIHAQFESIHPFLDGNGRLGRILIVLFLLQSKLIETPYFFLSEELEREKFKYYALLNGVRGIEKSSPDWKSWIGFFLDATIKMADHQYKKLHEAELLYQNGLKRIIQPSTQKVWTSMFKVPIANVKQLEHLTGLAPATIRISLTQLVELNLLFGDDRQRNRRFYLYDLISIMKD